MSRPTCVTITLVLLGFAAFLIGCPLLGLAVVPDVTGLSQAAAETQLLAAGLAVGNITFVHSDTVASGQVISQEPPGGALVSLGSATNLVVSQGPDSGEGEGEGEGELETGQVETIMLPGGVPFEMVWIEPGTFMMGRYPGEQDSDSNEDWQHKVTLTQGFWMAKYELTKAQWTAVMETTPWSGGRYVLDDTNSPAIYVSWNDAQSFITALNTLTGKNFRLPTEAEWEYACRAGTSTRFYWGDDPVYTMISDYAWWHGNAWAANEKHAHIVGLKLPNAWGLHDMSGNVWEWCNDWWEFDYSGGDTTDPVGPSSGLYRVARSGSWSGTAESCRSAGRTYGGPSAFYHFMGFRLAT